MIFVTCICLWWSWSLFCTKEPTHILFFAQRNQPTYLFCRECFTLRVSKRKQKRLSEDECMSFYMLMVIMCTTFKKKISETKLSSFWQPGSMWVGSLVLKSIYPIHFLWVGPKWSIALASGAISSFNYSK